MKLIYNIFSIILCSIFCLLPLKGQLYYEVVKEVNVSRCNISEPCTNDCCDLMDYKLPHNRILNIVQKKCEPNDLLTVIDQIHGCINISKSDIKNWFWQVNRPIRARTITTEYGLSVDHTENNTSNSVLFNVFQSYYKPLKFYRNGNNILVAGLRSGVAYGRVINDTNPSESNQSIIKLFKTELTIGLHSNREHFFTAGFGISPLNIRDGERISGVFPHASLTYSRFINFKDGKTPRTEDK